MLFHIINKKNVKRYPGVLERMFHQRYQVFVQTLGWRDLDCLVHYDIDAYDHADTEYLVGLSRLDTPVWHSRFNPTMGPHQLEDGGPLRKFAMDKPPNGPTIWEGSRGVGGLMQRHDHPEDADDNARIHFNPKDEASVKAAKKRLFSYMARGRIATQEFLIRRGATHCLGIADSHLMGRMAEMGWNHMALGPPVAYPEGEANGVVFEASEEILATNREMWGVKARQTYEAPSGTTPVPFAAFDMHSMLTHDQRAEWLSALSPIIGAKPPADPSGAEALDYLVRLENRYMVDEAMSMVKLIMEDAA